MKKNKSFCITLALASMFLLSTAFAAVATSSPTIKDATDKILHRDLPQAEDISATKTTLNGFVLSDRIVRISCGNATATFRLYDTVAAKQFYDQLPLTLQTENFRHAQWMFYPPKKLSVTANEAYHDGKKGELSYYEPWGDAFILYEDFYARDEMHRLGICLSGWNALAKMDATITVEKETDKSKAM